MTPACVKDATSLLQQQSTCFTRVPCCVRDQGVLDIENREMLGDARAQMTVSLAQRICVVARLSRGFVTCIDQQHNNGRAKHKHLCTIILFHFDGDGIARRTKRIHSNQDGSRDFEIAFAGPRFEKVCQRTKKKCDVN